MRIISENNVCENRPYVNLKKLSVKTSLRVASIDELGFKGTYIINQYTQSLCKNENYTSQYSNGIEKVTFYTSDLNEMLLVDINYSFKTGASYSKFKVYLILNNIKYALPFNYFEDIYRNCMDILAKEVNNNEEINYIKESFNNLKKEEISVDINLNLERLKEFKDKVDFKRNVRYFVINNIASSISKYDIKNKTNKIKVTDKVKVLRHNYKTRLYEFVNPTDNTNMVSLKETDIICDLGDENNFPTVNIYTSYGLGKLLDIKNNVVPSTNTLSLFANLLDLGLNVLN